MALESKYFIVRATTYGKTEVSPKYRIGADFINDLTDGASEIRLDARTKELHGFSFSHEIFKNASLSRFEAMADLVKRLKDEEVCVTERLTAFIESKI